MISAEWHPDDERLLSRYLDRDADPTLEAHLGRCGGCVARGEALQRELDRWHDAAAMASDAAFDAERLVAQRHGVRRRLGALVPARVLNFPAQDPAERHAPIARVAAAVLLVALTGAGVLRVLSMPPAAAPVTARARPATRAAAPVRLIHDATADAAALEDIDLALLRARTAVAELQALDEFTPHVRDLSPRR